jgi:hypothetical protein
MQYTQGLKTLSDKNRAPLPEIQSGQVWKMENSNLRIGMMGKTLVHYKQYKGDLPRAPIMLAGKAVLVKYLVDHEAVLVQS